MSPMERMDPEKYTVEELAGNAAGYLGISINEARERVPQLLREHRERIKIRGRCPGCAVCETFTLGEHE